MGVGESTGCGASNFWETAEGRDKYRELALGIKYI